MSVANAATLNVTVEVWTDEAVVSYSYGEAIPSQSTIGKQILQNCKNELEDIGLGSKIRGLNQSNATVGLGKITGVAIGKIYKGFAPGWGNEEYADPESWLSQFSKYYDDDGDNPNVVSTTYVAPCLFKGTISNLRTSSFYHFYIGNFETDEYDINDLKRKKWKLDLITKDLICSNYYEYDKLKGCQY